MKRFGAMFAFAMFAVVSFAIVTSGTVALAKDETKSGAMKSKPMAAALDGHTYKVEIAGEPSGDNSDWLVFDGGKFESTACRVYGFDRVSYTSKKEEGRTEFAAVTKSSSGGTMDWSGTIKGDAVEGVAHWTTAAGEKKEMKFTGKRVTGPLDGKHYHVELTTGEGTTARKTPDDLAFRHGTFDSDACRVYGFGRTNYTVTTGEGMSRFEATAKNAAGGINRWSGTIKGETIEGTMVSTDKDGKSVNYTFRGSAAATMAAAK